MMLRTSALIALLGLCVFGGAQTASAGWDTCGFAPNVGERRIALRHHLSCGQAKRVLRQLKANRRSNTVPMVCGSRPRVVQGWRLSNTGKGWGTVYARYQRGDVWFTYQRVDRPWPQAWCAPPGGSGEDVG
jgi:hypothetical protein